MLGANERHTEFATAFEHRQFPALASWCFGIRIRQASAALR